MYSEDPNLVEEAPTKAIAVPFYPMPLSNRSDRGNMEHLMMLLVHFLRKLSEKDNTGGGTLPPIPIENANLKVAEYLIGNGKDSDFVVAHAFQRIVSYMIVTNSETEETVEGDVYFTNKNAILEFDLIPDLNQYRLVLLGIPNTSGGSNA